MDKFLWVFLAGGLGCGARYLVTLWSVGRFGPDFPHGTLIVNVLGCFLIGLVSAIAVELAAFPPTLRLALTTGFLGGFTTYSTFNFETTRLLEGGAVASALINVGLTVLGGFVAGLLGLALGRLIVST